MPQNAPDPAAFGTPESFQVHARDGGLCPYLQRSLRKSDCDDCPLKAMVLPQPQRQRRPPPRTSAMATFIVPVRGTPSSDYILGEATLDFIYGEGGNDTIY